MRLLILGGGRFLGAAAMDCALARGHTVTVFNRGRSRRQWPSGVEWIAGDRVKELQCLSGRHWDAVLDTCGYVPREIRISAEALIDCGRYLFVSSISAFASFAHPPLRESDALAQDPRMDPEDRNPAFYGVQKASCEKAVQTLFEERALIVRPGLIIGPRDPTGRFSYWPWRIASGGEALVPEVPQGHPLQLIDVRDLAEWMLRLLEQGERGVYIATGAAGQSWPAMLRDCAEAARLHGHSAADPVAIPEAFLRKNEVQPWTELPLWLPSGDPEWAGFMQADSGLARSKGLRTRPLAETIEDILTEGLPEAGDPRWNGRLSREREKALIEAWKAR